MLSTLPPWFLPSLGVLVALAGVVVLIVECVRDWRAHRAGGPPPLPSYTLAAVLGVLAVIDLLQGAMGAAAVDALFAAALAWLTYTQRRPRATSCS